MFNVRFCDNNCNVFLLVGEHLKRRKRKGFETFAVSSSAYIYKKLKRSRKKSRTFSGRNPRKIQEEIHKEKYLRNLRSAAVVRFAGKATAGFAEGKQYCGWGQQQASTILRNIYCNTGIYCQNLNIQKAVQGCLFVCGLYIPYLTKATDFPVRLNE